MDRTRRTLLKACGMLALPGTLLANAGPFRIGVAPYTSARVIIEQYQPLRRHLERQLGRPALVVPHITKTPVRLGRVLIAWKPTREAARAVTAALPILQQAERVTVAAFDEGEPPAADTGILGYLRQHGVQAEFKREVASELGDVGDQLLSLAADEQSDLLVMGCYGHGRAREWVLGGASRTVIASMTIPVLMSH